MAEPQFTKGDIVRWHPAYAKAVIELRIIRLDRIDEDNGEPWYFVYDGDKGQGFPLPEHVLTPTRSGPSEPSDAVLADLRRRLSEPVGSYDRGYAGL